MRRSTWLTLLAASHDIWLFTNEWLMAERGLSVADLAFYHEWPSIFDSEQEPWNQAHFFTPGNRLSDCGVNKKAIVPPRHTDQRVNMQLLTQRGRVEEAEGRRKKGKKKQQGLWLAVAVPVWFKWVHGVLDKQSDRSACVTGQALSSNDKVRTTEPWRELHLKKKHKSYD